MNIAQQNKLNELADEYEREIGPYSASVHGKINYHEKVEAMESILAEHYSQNPHKGHLRKYMKAKLCTDLGL